MTDDDHRRVGIKARDGAEDTRDHRLAGDFMEHLGAVGAHPGTESGGKNHGGERRRHQGGLYKNGGKRALSFKKAELN